MNGPDRHSQELLRRPRHLKEVAAGGLYHAGELLAALGRCDSDLVAAGKRKQFPGGGPAPAELQPGQNHPLGGLLVTPGIVVLRQHGRGVDVGVGKGKQTLFALGFLVGLAVGEFDGCEDSQDRGVLRRGPVGLAGVDKRKSRLRQSHQVEPRHRAVQLSRRRGLLQPLVISPHSLNEPVSLDVLVLPAAGLYHQGLQVRALLEAIEGACEGPDRLVVSPGVQHRVEVLDRQGVGRLPGPLPPGNCPGMIEERDCLTVQGQAVEHPGQFPRHIHRHGVALQDLQHYTCAVGRCRLVLKRQPPAQRPAVVWIKLYRSPEFLAGTGLAPLAEKYPPITGRSLRSQGGRLSLVGKDRCDERRPVVGVLAGGQLRIQPPHRGGVVVAVCGQPGAPRPGRLGIAVLDFVDPRQQPVYQGITGFEPVCKLAQCDQPGGPRGCIGGGVDEVAGRVKQALGGQGIARTWSAAGGGR